MLYNVLRLDEKAIQYGRTGVWPSKSKLPLSSIPNTQKIVDVKSESKVEVMSRTLSPHHLAPPKSPSNFPLIQRGETMRSLSPAEQVYEYMFTWREREREKAFTFYSLSSCSQW
jgi:hypothetical protein